MRLLLDTHTFLWWTADSPRLSDTARGLIRNPDNELFLSAASGWEMAIKAQLGKLRISGDIEQFVAEQMSLNAIHSLPITMMHALHVQKLPLHHRDPFDRVLIAQSQLEQMPILTIDSVFRHYQVETLW